ncbi:MAG: hypothetical protein ACK4Q5_19470, partial [Saprospiraceae bacterium]
TLFVPADSFGEKSVKTSPQILKHTLNLWAGHKKSDRFRAIGVLRLLQNPADFTTQPTDLSVGKQVKQLPKPFNSSSFQL